MSHRAPPERDWRLTILRLKTHHRLTYGALGKRIGVPETTLENLGCGMVGQPLHSTGERILALYRQTFPER